MQIETIVFDFGNVVGFFDHRRATRRLAEQTGLAEDLIYRQAMDPELEIDYESGRISSAEFLRRLKESLGIDQPDHLLGEIYGDIFWPNNEVCELVPRLAGRYRMVLGSNTTELHSRRFRREFADTLGHFHALVLSHEIGHRKPKREFYEHCQSRAGSPAERCVFIDDLESNIAGAQAAGMHGIVYQPGSLDRKSTRLNSSHIQKSRMPSSA